MFGASGTSSTIQLAPGQYEIDMQIYYNAVYSVNPTTLTLGILGTAVCSDINFIEEVWNRTGGIADSQTYTAQTPTPTLRRNVATQSLNTSSLTRAVVSGASTNQTGIYRVKGIFTVTTTGTVILSATLAGHSSTTATILAGSYCKITPFGEINGYWT
jgi:hypothetical protein